VYSLIEKETDEHRTLNVQHRTLNDCIPSVLKRFREAIDYFVIRQSSFHKVSHERGPLAKKTASLIKKET
jgi:hypothetical protein